MRPLPQVTGAPPAEVALPSCIDRRAFLGNSAMLAVGAVLATACGDGTLGSGPTGPTFSRTSIKVADYAALSSVGGVVRLSGTSTPAAVVRTASTTYRAFSLVCPHQGTTVGINGTAGFLCPNHEARFSTTGEWLGGQPTTNMREYLCLFDAATGILTIG